MVTVQSQAKFHKTGVKCEAFLRMFMKFYLADTPHRRNARILEVGSEQKRFAKQNFINRRKMPALLRMFMKFYLADTPHRRNARILEVGTEQLIKM